MNQYTGKSFEERFFDNISIDDKSGCWIWTGCLRGQYGIFTYNGLRDGAHRHSYRHFYGEFDNNLLVRHKCPGGHNTFCVNPNHLELGTDQDNSNDTVEAGRSRKGEASPLAKLTQDSADEIRELYKTGKYTYNQLAELFGVKCITISEVMRHIRWNG